MNSEECKMTFSAFVRDKTGKRFVRVCFERAGQKETDRAEGVVPGGRIDRSWGFTDDEIRQLSGYLVEHEADILTRAKEISSPMHWL